MAAVQITDTDYRRLLKMLTLRAYRFLGMAHVAGTDPVLGESGQSPEDFAIAALGKWLTKQLKYDGPTEKILPFLSSVMFHDMLDALKKRGVKAARTGTTVSISSLTEAAQPASSHENVWDIRRLLRDDAFRHALQQSTQGDSELQDFVYAVTEWDGDAEPAPREIAEFLGIHVKEVQNRKRKLARRLTKQGVQQSPTGRR